MLIPRQRADSSPLTGVGAMLSKGSDMTRGEVHGGSGRFWRWLPVAARARILVLFAVLAFVKVAMLFGLGHHLREIHWRLNEAEETWVNPVAFYLFVGLGVAGLAQLARYCRAAGVGAVRAVNFTVLALGLLFIFLTFHSGENNYLFPILNGILKWDSLGPYLSLDLCFRQPYLAAWLLGYAGAYYVLARTGRESWTFHLTVLCAGAYALLYLRGLSLYLTNSWSRTASA